MMTTNNERTTTTPSCCKSFLVKLTISLLVLGHLHIGLLFLPKNTGPLREQQQKQKQASSTTTTTTKREIQQPKNSTTTSSSISSSKEDADNASTSSPAAVARALKSMGLEPIYDENITTDPWKTQLYQRLDRIRVICGELCQINDMESLRAHQKTVDTSHLKMVTVPDVNCEAILASEDIDAGDTTIPTVPVELLKYYLLSDKGSRPGIVYRQYNRSKMSNIFLGGESEKGTWVTGNVWKEADVNKIVEDARNRALRGTYSTIEANWVIDRLATVDLKGKSALVIGSSHPWIEAILLLHGAGMVTTLEYGYLVSEHPKIRTMTPSVFRRRYLSGELEKFDWVVSWSSLEHSGLGRYGDALNPWGDILAVARAWCVTKPGGYLYLGLPPGIDAIVSNHHRIYGTVRWPLIAANWKPLDKTDGAELLARRLRRTRGYLFRKEEGGQ